MIAICFPGQGSQQPGMATPWVDLPAASRWAEADEILGWDVSRLGIDAPAEELTEPLNCQVALFVHHVVLFETWRAAHPEVDIAMTAGHSLGEYNALHAAGAMPFDDGLKLVEVRANATQAAADDMPGTMIAALGFEVEDVRAACAQAGAHVANDNAVGQITVSGTPDQLAAVKDILADGRGKVRDIPVGAAYHSPHMAAAVEPLGQALDATAFTDTAVPIVANVDATPHSDGAVWPDLLRRQVTSPVRWRESVLTMKEAGISEIVELGATAVIGPMVKRIDRSITRTSITAPGEI